MVAVEIWFGLHLILPFAAGVAIGARTKEEGSLRLVLVWSFVFFALSVASFVLGFVIADATRNPLLAWIPLGGVIAFAVMRAIPPRRA